MVILSLSCFLRVLLALLMLNAQAFTFARAYLSALARIPITTMAKKVATNKLAITPCAAYTKAQAKANRKAEKAQNRAEQDEAAAKAQARKPKVVRVTSEAAMKKSPPFVQGK